MASAKVTVVLSTLELQIVDEALRMYCRKLALLAGREFGSDKTDKLDLDKFGGSSSDGFIATRSILGQIGLR